jgi:flagellar protein FlgJ
MGISVGSDLSYYSSAANAASDNVKAEELQAKLKNKTATDEETMEVCKSFEAYMLEQVMKEMKKTVPEGEDEKSPYLEQFGDMLYEGYAEKATENQGIGIAQMLYDAMKHNQ